MEGEGWCSLPPCQSSQGIWEKKLCIGQGCWRARPVLLLLPLPPPQGHLGRLVPLCILVGEGEAHLVHGRVSPEQGPLLSPCCVTLGSSQTLSGPHIITHQGTSGPSQRPHQNSQSEPTGVLSVDLTPAFLRFSGSHHPLLKPPPEGFFVPSLSGWALLPVSGTGCNLHMQQGSSCLSSSLAPASCTRWGQPPPQRLTDQAPSCKVRGCRFDLEKSLGSEEI